MRSLKGVGPRREHLLRSLGVRDRRDLLEQVPRDYRFFLPALGPGDLEEGKPVLLSGRLSSAGLVRASGQLSVVRALLEPPGMGPLPLVWFFRGRRGALAAQRQVDLLKAAPWVTVLGVPRRHRGRWQIVAPHVEARSLPGEETLRLMTQRPSGAYPAPAPEGVIVPVYRSVSGISPAQWQGWIQQALDDVEELVPEFLDPAVRERLDLPARPDAWREVHRPTSQRNLRRAWRRLAFDEAVFLQLVLAQQSRSLQGEAPRLPPAGSLSRDFLARLPFSLTADQRRAMGEIDRDLSSSRPMRRLLQGDVGTGKTVVAAYALARVVEGGYQGAVMAPTEVLAEQLATAIDDFLRPLGVNVAFFHGGLPPAKREALLQALRRQDAQVVVGTQALLSDEVRIPALVLVVVDEQHRFGVSQRLRLLRAGRQGTVPHLLTMSATPIPRSLAKALLGEVDVSRLRERPAGRRPVDTRWLPESRRERAYDFVRRLVAQGKQAYVVFPRLEGGAQDAFEWLREGPLRGARVELLHARLPSEEKDRIMQAFRRGEIDVLVATTVVEVGVDVPNAAVIVIEEPDRFGLAQLHQLRGRVGRGQEPGYCLLIGDGSTPASRARLRMFRNCHDGFTLAEYDLRQRGPGEAWGLRQSGPVSLRFFDPVSQADLLPAARQVAHMLLDEMENGQAAGARDAGEIRNVVRAELARFRAAIGGGEPLPCESSPDLPKECG